MYVRLDQHKNCSDDFGTVAHLVKNMGKLWDIQISLELVVVNLTCCLSSLVIKHQPSMQCVVGSSPTITAFFHSVWKSCSGEL